MSFLAEVLRHKRNCSVFTIPFFRRSSARIQVRKVVELGRGENNQNCGLNGNTREENQIFWECETKIFEKADDSFHELLMLVAS
jgi:hypothetical protein